MSEPFELALTSEAEATHADLVRVASRWLRRVQKCGVVLAEHSGGGEHPDAIGWRSSASRLVECKVSREDFAADRHKPSRLGPKFRPAGKCWYLTPRALVTVEELPLGWGLLEYDGRVVRVVKDPPEEWENAGRDPSTIQREIVHLYCELRRYQSQGIVYQKIKPGGGYDGLSVNCAQLQEAHAEGFTSHD